jgi:hypothetical protein
MVNALRDGPSATPIWEDWVADSRLFDPIDIAPNLAIIEAG